MEIALRFNLFCVWIDSFVSLTRWAPPPSLRRDGWNKFVFVLFFKIKKDYKINGKMKKNPLKSNYLLLFKCGNKTKTNKKETNW